MIKISKTYPVNFNKSQNKYLRYTKNIIVKQIIVINIFGISNVLFISSSFCIKKLIKKRL